MRKVGHAAAFVTLFVVTMLLVNVVHFRFFPVHVVLYAAILDAVIALGLTALLVWRLRLLGGLAAFERFLLGVVCILLGYVHAISVPTVIDRSLSIYILEKLDQRGGAIRQSALADVFVSEYLPEHRLVDVRLTEQLASGTVVVEDGCVRLTPFGRRIVAVSRFYRTTILPKNRVLLGERTDALTDPFRASRTDVDYGCAPAGG